MSWSFPDAGGSCAVTSEIGLYNTYYQNWQRTRMTYGDGSFEDFYEVNIWDNGEIVNAGIGGGGAGIPNIETIVTATEFEGRTIDLVFPVNNGTGPFRAYKAFESPAFHGYFGGIGYWFKLPD